MARSSRSGLTLIEVLLAIAILSVGVTVLLTGMSRCLAVMKMARKYQAAQWTLGMGEAEHPLIPTDDIEDLEVDDVTYENGFTFSREIEDDDEDEDGLYVVRTKVTWSDRGQQSCEEVVRYLYQPEEE